MPVVTCSGCSTPLNIPDAGGAFRCPRCSAVCSAPAVPRAAPAPAALPVPPPRVKVFIPGHIPCYPLLAGVFRLLAVLSWIGAVVGLILGLTGDVVRAPIGYTSFVSGLLTGVFFLFTEYVIVVLAEMHNLLTDLLRVQSER